MPHDQREEDSDALVFTGQPLQAPVEIFGAVQLDLVVSSDQPVTMDAARLSDVSPDEKAIRVTYGLLNPTHRGSHEQPTPIETGTTYRIRIRLNDLPHAFPAGHRVRLSLSTSCWPLAWPPPRPVRLSIGTGQSRILLPVRNASRGEDRRIRFAEPQGAAPPELRPLSGPERN